MDELQPFPFLALVGQPELKTALVLALVNPQIGGVLLIGPYGVGKTTAVRGLIDVMPLVDVEETDAEGNATTHRRPMRIIELPLNARMEDVVGGINERVAIEQQRVMLDEGVLARAHRNLLYIDEVNLLDARVVDAILDAAAQGRTFVRRGPMTRLYPSQFVLVGSMNPQEGVLRPQILDRFGLRVWVAPLMEREHRLEIYRRARSFRENAETFRAAYAEETGKLKQEIVAAREILPYVTIDPDAERFAIECIQQLAIPSHRAEIALFEAARARAAADFRISAGIEDIRRVAILALRQRRSVQIDAYAETIATEDAVITRVIEAASGQKSRRRRATRRARTTPPTVDAG
ncbi:MAG: ATP-binding protein [Chloroflexi bacterium]|nr:ATP-binding protein [Chloroflexota bacterium]